MAKYIIMGAQWGDEGKGKFVDFLADHADVVVRFQGGANAGHTIVRDGVQFILHIIPGGIISGHCLNIIGNGCVIDPESLVEEIVGLEKMGVAVTQNKLVISSRAHLVTPVHKFVDCMMNERIGTTGRGIGPCYMDKVQRTGIRIEDFVADDFKQRYLEHAEHYKKITECAYDMEFIDIQDSVERLEKIQHQLKPFIKDSVAIISDAVSSNKSILYEGAQGAFLDVDHGTYPFVTSSNTTIGGAYSGGGVYLEFDKRIGIVKAYTTRVGAGPFPTELKNVAGEKLREKGREFGATTGRPRRCGWLDLNMLKRSFITNGFNYVVLTKLDCLNGFDTLKVAVDYDAQNQPVYENLPGWEEDIVGITDYDKLPTNCRNYIKFIEDYLSMKIGLISTGPDRKDVIFQEKL